MVLRSCPWSNIFSSHTQPYTYHMSHQVQESLVITIKQEVRLTFTCHDQWKQETEGDNRFILVCGGCRQHPLASLLALCWCCLPHWVGVFTQHCRHCGIVVVPCLIVIDCIGQRCPLWWSMPALHWHLFRHCADVVALIVLPSLHNIVVVAALLLYMALVSSTGSAHVVVCTGCHQQHTGVFAGVALVSSSSLRRHLCATS